MTLAEGIHLDTLDIRLKQSFKCIIHQIHRRRVSRDQCLGLAVELHAFERIDFALRLGQEAIDLWIAIVGEIVGAA